MVDLVKARRKAKEKKSSEEQAPAATQSEESSSSAAGKQTAAEPAAPEVGGSEEAAFGAGDGAPAGTDPALPPAPGAEAAPSRRLAQIKQSLGVRRLFATGDAGQHATAAEQLLELLLFSISGEMYAVPIEQIVEIIKPRPATRVPNADETIVGIISLRGTIVTILDVRRRLGHTALAAVSDDTRIVVIQHGEETAGFVVDRVWRVVRIEPSLVRSSPAVTSAEQNEFINGVFQHGKNLAILLDLEKLLRS